MENLGLLIMLAGLLVSVVGQLWFLLGAFVENVLWGLAILFVPGAGLVYLWKRTDVAVKPMFVTFGGLGITAWGLALASEGGEMVMLVSGAVAALVLVAAGMRMLATSQERQPGAGTSNDLALQRALAPLRVGDKAGAQKRLIEILQAEPKNDQAWLWMARVVENDALRRDSLEEALKHNPRNKEARRALKKLREAPAARSQVALRSSSVRGGI